MNQAPGTACLRALALLAFAAVTLVACRSRRDAFDEHLMAECQAGTCTTVDESNAAGAAFDVHADWRGTNGGHVLACELVARHPSEDAGAGYRLTRSLFTGDVFPFGDAIAKVARCSEDDDPRGGNPRAHLVLTVNPTAYASLAPAKGNVVVPFTMHVDDLVLDGGLTARARLDRDTSDRPSPDSVTLVVFAPAAGETVYRAFHVGAHFTWGPHQAEIVRIVPPATSVTGWVEVALH